MAILEFGLCTSIGEPRSRGSHNTLKWPQSDSLLHMCVITRTQHKLTNLKLRTQLPYVYISFSFRFCGV